MIEQHRKDEGITPRKISDEEIVQPRLDDLLVVQQHRPVRGVLLRTEEPALQQAHQHPTHRRLEDAAVAGEAPVEVILHGDRGDEGVSHRCSPVLWWCR